MALAGPETSLLSALPNDTFNGLKLKFSIIPAPCVPLGKVISLSLIPVILSGSSTFRDAEALSPRTIRVIVTDPARSGAVQVNEGPLPLVGEPALAVHAPAALPVKTTRSPTPTSARDFGDPSGAAKSVSWAIFGAGRFGFDLRSRKIKSNSRIRRRIAAAPRTTNATTGLSPSAINAETTAANCGTAYRTRAPTTARANRR